MSSLEILRSRNLIHEDNFSYVERDIDAQFSAVEIWRAGDKAVLFREFYFIVDNTTENVYMADFKEPDVVFVVKIQRGIIKPLEFPATA